MFGSARLAPERARAPLARARATPRRHRGRHPRDVAETPPAPPAAIGGALLGLGAYGSSGSDDADDDDA